jgi:hypothetical protein
MRVHADRIAVVIDHMDVARRVDCNGVRTRQAGISYQIRDVAELADCINGDRGGVKVGNEKPINFRCIDVGRPGSRTLDKNGGGSQTSCQGPIAADFEWRTVPLPLT